MFLHRYRSVRILYHLLTHIHILSIYIHTHLNPPVYPEAFIHVQLITLHCITLHCITIHCIALHNKTQDSIHTNIHTYIHTYKHTYKHTYIQTCIQTYIHTCIQTYIRTCHYIPLHTITNHDITLSFKKNIHTLQKPTNQPTKQTNRQTNKQTNKQRHKQTYIHECMHTITQHHIPFSYHYKPLHYITLHCIATFHYKQTNKQTNKHTYIHTYTHTLQNKT